ncbi:hypothetical protein [Selenomonas sp.]|uniref:hypothetical protein n=1 Tax=Selenomonas sp. TaxID=2053611 RepID=UPI0025EDADD4|nr:hypothetical protein [Selenomonas sp.]MBQ1867628.1 hypothetical protein [Selenomonas sp.]
MKRTWTLLAMFLALAMLVQSIRLFIPMIPGPVNMFLIGSLLNTIMVLSIWQTGSRWAAMIGGLLPFGAFAQGQLPIIWMIPVVAGGNMAFTLWAGAFRQSRLLYLAPVVKTVILYGGTLAVLRLIHLPEAMIAVLLFMMSWPQLVTGTVGIVLARKMSRRIPTFL